LLYLSLLISCTLTAAPKPAPQSQEDFEPIRFGDTEELAYTAEFFPGASYDESIPSPDQLLGQKHGTRLAHHAEVLDAFRVWTKASPRMTLHTFGQTHEGRELCYAVITSPENQSKIDRLRENHAKLADPRGLGVSEAQSIIDDDPAVAWMGYSIHGDELSGTDASLAIAYHLISSQDAKVRALLNDLVIIIDPCLNPDGRERIIGMVEQSAGYTPNLDYASMHRGRWPFGRGNHYLFDMNRDWIAGSQPETRARWKAVLDWNPQLFVDAHEMGSLDTFLFYPQAAPFNPELPENTVKWQTKFADAASQDFDAEGWSYYTREWADAWGPFYSDAWGSLTGAVGILYEQASTAGFQLRRASGEILTYREAVHHQVVASMANLETLRVNRSEILTDYLANKRKNVSAETEGNELSLAVIPHGNVSRMQDLRRILDGQRLEYSVIATGATLRSARSARGVAAEEVDLPDGTLILPARQPQRQLLRAFFEFDPQIDSATLKLEREELERKNISKMYDVTAWSLPHALDLDAWWGTLDETKMRAPDERAATGLTADSEGSQSKNRTVYGWVVDGTSDSSVAFAARAMEAGLPVYASDVEFQVEDKHWPRGSLLVRRGETQRSIEEVEHLVGRAAEKSGAQASRVYSGRAPGTGPDLGGGHFQLLARPRVALLANSPVDSSTYGHLWHHIDVVLGLPFSIIDTQSLGSTDLRRYNVLVLPPGGYDSVIEPIKDDLANWVLGGGTLIACGDSAAMLSSGRLAMSSVSLRRDALEDLDVYARALQRERDSQEIEIDEKLIWKGESQELDEEPSEPKDKESTEGDKAPMKELDAWMRRFSPSGANLLAGVDTSHWLTYGSDSQIPIGASGSRVFLAKAPVEIPVRFTTSDNLRLGGLLWPEARERLADSAWLTRESSGNGQVILFAGVPGFRGYHHATARFFSNALVFGPGLGSNQPVGW
jgi:hypothetical protein